VKTPTFVTSSNNFKSFHSDTALYWLGLCVHSEVLKCMFILHYVAEVSALLKGPEMFVL
jgi:hypothetical protein